jgi:ribosomal protein S7
MTKAAIIQGLDMVKNQVNPVVPVETIKTNGGTPEVPVDPTKDGGANTANANTANANTEGSKEETVDSREMT